MIPVLIAHGGIEYRCSNPATPNSKEIALKNAVIQGYEELRLDGGSSVDAVEKTIRILEDDEHFNAGYGSVFNAEGEVELDAGMMNGTSLEVGSVGAVKEIDHPISVAKKVMTSTEHSLLVGEGAKKFAAKMNIGSLIPSRKSYDYYRNHANRRGESTSMPETCTVGVVAIDVSGRCTVGTSSGGGSYKLAGRVGSSGIVGAGFYADSSIGGCVATGHGESIMRCCLCFNIASKLAMQRLRGDYTMLAVKNVVKTATRESKNSIGVVGLDSEGEFFVAFSAPRMPWVYRRSGELRFGAESGENNLEYVSSIIES